MPMLTIEGTTFHYQQQGAGVDVVLLHAFTGNLSTWVFSGIASALAADYRVTCYDLRGHGYSDVTLHGYDSASMVDDLTHLLKALEINQAHLVGHSFGGVIAMQAACRIPKQVASVVLSDVYFPGLRHLEPDMGQTAVWSDLREQLLQLGADIGEQVDFTRLFAVVAAWSADDKKQAEQVLGPAAARWLFDLRQLAPTSAGEEMFEVAGLTPERIASIQQPVSALYDEHSPFLATRDFLQQHLPQCRVGLIPGARHLAPMENPTALLQEIRQHLETACLAQEQASRSTGQARRPCSKGSL